MRASLAARIVLPFIALHLVVIALAATVAVALVSRAVERSLDAQVERVSRVLVDSGFALDSGFLQHFKNLLGAEVVVFRPDGATIAETLQHQDAVGFVDAWRAARIDTGTYRLEGEPLRFAVRSLPTTPGRPNARLALLLPEGELRGVQRRTTIAIALTGGGSALVLVLLGSWIARGISNPLSQLARAADRIARGDDREETQVLARDVGVLRRADEVGQLADAFDRMTENLHRYEGELARSARLAAAGRIAAGLAHEIRNPLSSIRMLVQLTLENPGVDGEMSRSLQTVLREAERLEHTVRNLLDVARPTRPLWAEVSPARLTTEVLDLVGPRLKHQRIVLDESRSDGAPTVLVADGDRLKQALLNLIINAIEAMPSGGLLRVRLGPAGDGGARWEIVDNGRGIPSEVADHLFEPFASTKPDGVGLGLYISQRIAEEHGGRVFLEPADGRGTRAVLEAPARPLAGADSHG